MLLHRGSVILKSMQFASLNIVLYFISILDLYTSIAVRIHMVGRYNSCGNHKAKLALCDEIHASLCFLCSGSTKYTQISNVIN